MLQTMRNNAQGLFAKIIMAFLVIVFGLWGVESVVSIGSGEKATVEVDGQKITEAEIERAVERQRMNLSRQFGEQFNADLFNDQFLRQAAIEQLINDKVAIVQAHKLGLKASTKTIDQAIVQEQAFQLNGRFDATQFRDVLRMNGMSPTDFRNAMANDIVINQAQAGFALSSIATPFNVKLGASLEQEERTFKYHEIKAADLIASIALSDEEIEQNYQANKEQFRTPELVAVDYVEIKLADIAANLEVSAAEVEQAYNDYKARQQATEQREASHILLELDNRTLTEAKALANELKQRIDDGEDFAVLAKEYSDDIGSKNIGGELGLSPRGSFDEAFDNALYSLPEGGVSNPLETDFGVHLIRADKIVQAEVRPFAEMQQELAQEVRLDKAQQDYESRIINMSDVAFSSTSISELAQALNLEVKQSALFTRDEGESIADNMDVRDAAYADNVLFDKELSPMIELKDSAVVLSVAQHQEESYRPLADVREQIVAEMKARKAAQLAEANAQKLASDSDKITWKTVVTSYSLSSEAPRAVQQRAFALQVEQQDVVQTADGYAIVKLSKIDAKPWQDVKIESEQQGLARMFNGRVDLFSYQNWARNTTKIQKNKS